MKFAYITPSGKRVEQIEFKGSKQRLTPRILEHVGYTITLMNKNLRQEGRLQDIEPDQAIREVFTHYLLAPEGFIDSKDTAERRLETNSIHTNSDQPTASFETISIDEQLAIICAFELDRHDQETLQPGTYHLEVELDHTQQTPPVKTDFTRYSMDGDKIFKQIPYHSKQNGVQALMKRPRHLYEPKLKTTLEDAMELAYDLKNTTIRVIDREVNIYPCGKPKEAPEKDRIITRRADSPEELLKQMPNDHSPIQFFPSSQVWASQTRTKNTIARVLTYGYQDIHTGAPNQPNTYRTVVIKGTVPRYWKV